ncbi:MAG: hypothetical protein IJ106_09315 [Parasporobacterium sp.]|nr:hypothetical protein [Parasporobacterium sp.]
MKKSRMMERTEALLEECLVRVAENRKQREMCQPGIGAPQQHAGQETTLQELLRGYHRGLRTQKYRTALKSSIERVLFFLEETEGVCPFNENEILRDMIYIAETIHREHGNPVQQGYENYGNPFHREHGDHGNYENYENHGSYGRNYAVLIRRELIRKTRIRKTICRAAAVTAAIGVLVLGMILVKSLRQDMIDIAAAKVVSDLADTIRPVLSGIFQ